MSFFEKDFKNMSHDNDLVAAAELDKEAILNGALTTAEFYPLCTEHLVSLSLIPQRFHPPIL